MRTKFIFGFCQTIQAGAAALVVAISGPLAFAAQGDLDTTFGGSGKVTTGFGAGVPAEAKSVAISTNGKIIVAGSVFTGRQSIDWDFAVVRYNWNGTLDTTFGAGGKVLTDFTSGSSDTIAAVAIQSDGKILVAGTTSNGTGNRDNFAVARYNENGSLDATFNGTGKVITDFNNFIEYGTCMALQPDGKILVGGTTANTHDFDIALARYNSDGTLDTTFNGTGKVSTDFGGDEWALDVLALTGGKILVAARNRLVRYNTDGSLDTGFAGTGSVTISCQAARMAVYGTDKIVVSGSSQTGFNSDFALARYNSDGTFDATFNGGALIVADLGSNSDSGRGIRVQSDGRIVVLAGGPADFTVLRYTAGGALDASFGGTGKVTTDFGGSDSPGGLALAPDGKIVVAGAIDAGGTTVFGIARYDGGPDTDGDGIPDAAETGTGVFVSIWDTGTSPTNPDSDGDGLPDGVEIYTYHSNPNLKDTDGDGFEDGFEVATGFDPTLATSTPDAQSAIYFAVEYRFNAANGVSYRVETSTDLVNWSTIETPVIGNGGTVTRFYSTVGQPKRFFRSRRN